MAKHRIHMARYRGAFHTRVWCGRNILNERTVTDWQLVTCKQCQG